MKITTVAIFAASLTLLPASIMPLRAADSMKLIVDMAGCKLDSAYPVRTGVPFENGKLKSIENIRVMIGGKETDSQARLLAMWPDRSVKWALLDFFAKDGEVVTVEYGEGVNPKLAADGIQVLKDPDAITLDSGVIRLTVRKNGTAFIDELAFDKNGNGKYDSDETVIASAAPEEQRYFLDFIHRPFNQTFETMQNFIPGGTVGKSTVEIKNLSLEEEGPLHCVILIRGYHKVPKLGARAANRLKHAGQSEFTLRIHVYKGSGVVIAEAHFVYDGCPDDDFLKAWGMRIPLSKGMRFTTYAEGKILAVPTSAAAPFAAITQDSADSFRVWVADADRFGQTDLARGVRANGWVDLSASDWGVTIGTRWFWERWPNAIHYESSTGKAEIMLYPPESKVLDLRRYARHEWGVGETGAPEGDLEDYAAFAAKGTGNSKEIRLVFHKGAAVDAGKTSAEYKVFNDWPLAKGDPSHYSMTRALGYWAPRLKGQYDDFEKAFEVSLNKKIEGQKNFRWYGMWDYGDYQQRFGDDPSTTHNHGRWENDWGRWGWGQGDGQGRLDRDLFLEYLRTGERRYFEQGEAMARHRADVDIVQTREYPWDWSVMRKFPPERTKGPWWDLRGCSHRHNVQHWGCAYVGARGGNPVGQKFYYYLTGNGRAGDMLDMAAEMGMIYNGWGGYERVPQRYGHSGDNDGQGTGLQAILIAWERTGDVKYRDALKSSLKDELLRPKNEPWEMGMSDAFGMLQAIVDYALLTGDAEARQVCVENANKIKTLKRNWMWPGSFIGIVAGGYRLTGDPQLLSLLKSMVKEQTAKGVDGNVGFYISLAISAIHDAGRK
jgi:hypothetical protein